jgi:iron complex outermembrane recepter protein
MRSNRVLKMAVAYSLAMASSLALAQQAPQSPAAEEGADLETVIVTGTYIRGTAEDAALPVQVLSAEDLAKQGSPSTVELLKSLPASSGVLGDTNQFDARAQATEGVGSVNLRGFGPSRTLVLLNGRRLANNAITSSVDTNLLPVSAIGRIEVLKDGGAVTYGSDAVAGVVNFITKSGFNGLDITADYKNVKDTDGDYSVGITYGWGGDDIDFLVSAGYQHRSELKVRDRDFAHRPYLENPQGGYSAASNPASFVPLGAAGPIAAPIRDPQCGPLGGFPGVSATNAAVCYFQFSVLDALIEKEDHYQAYAEFNWNLPGDIKWHTEALYAGSEVPDYRTSPSFATLQTPTSLATGGTSPVAGQYFVPIAGNPGFASFNAANPGVFPAGTTNLLVVGYRPFGLGGNPLFNYGPSEGARNYFSYRISSGLSGTIGDDINWDTAVTYSNNDRNVDARDSVVNRLQLALRGLGGPNCFSGSAPGVGNCSYLNPFSTAIPRNPNTGVVNSQFASFGVPNDNRALLEWIFPKYHVQNKTDILTVDAVLSGKFGFEFSGGEPGWAVGAQYRDSSYETEFSGLGDLTDFPCINSVRAPTAANPTGAVGAAGCTADELSRPTGVYVFLTGQSDAKFTQDVIAVFSELSLPFFDNFQGQLAARYEDYGGATGSTFDPKLALKWQVIDEVALRASVGTTFRGPPLNFLTRESVTTLQQVASVFRAVRTFGNPDLEPESAFNYNLGVLVKAGPFTGSVDYFSFDFEDQIVAEPLAGMVATLFPSNLGTAGRCGDPAFAGLQSRFTFGPAGCAAGSGNITAVSINQINGPDVKTTGIDLSGKLDLDVGNGTLGVGVGGTVVLEYETDAVSVEGVTVQRSFDAVGKLNFQTTAFPLPKYKGAFTTEYSIGDHNIRYVVNYTHKYIDQRTDIFLPSPITVTNGLVAGPRATVTGGKTIGSYTVHNLYYQVQLPEDMTLTLGVENLFDRDPSFARLELNYDPFTGSPVGRAAKLGLRKKF